MPRNRQKVGAQDIDINIHSSGTLHGVDMQDAACLMHQGRHLRDRLNNPGFVIGQHHRNERAAFLVLPPCAELPGERSEVDHARFGHRESPHRPGRKAASRQDRRVLDARHQQVTKGRLVRPTAPRPGRKHQHIRFGATGGEDDIPRLGPDQCSDLLTRLLHHPAGGPALGMDRGGVTA